mmetsp:Transcript_56220/g.123413  ORF Transcript_56220/g.123413 Transcript_56220/m.123413 type:complete len:246 (+) Transcript_56220:419-1156(+)
MAERNRSTSREAMAPSRLKRTTSFCISAVRALQVCCSCFKSRPSLALSPRADRTTSSSFCVAILRSSLDKHLRTRASSSSSSPARTPSSMAVRKLSCKSTRAESAFSVAAKAVLAGSRSLTSKPASSPSLIAAINLTLPFCATASRRLAIAATLLSLSAKSCLKLLTSSGSTPAVSACSMAKRKAVISSLAEASLKLSRAAALLFCSTKAECASSISTKSKPSFLPLAIAACNKSVSLHFKAASK